MCFRIIGGDSSHISCRRLNRKDRSRRPPHRIHRVRRSQPPTPVPSLSRVCACLRPTGSRSRAPTAVYRVPAPSCRRTRPLVPRATVGACPLQHLEVPAHCRVRARICVPRTAVRPCPLQDVEASAPRRHRARPPVPRAAARAQRLQLSKCPPLAAAAQRYSRCDRRPRRCRRCIALEHPRYMAPHSSSSLN